MTWNAAKRHCEGMGAKLASLRNEWSTIYSELMAINLRASLWIGLNRREVESTQPLKLHIPNYLKTIDYCNFFFFLIANNLYGVVQVAFYITYGNY